MTTTPITTPQIYANLKTWQNEHEKAIINNILKSAEIDEQYSSGEITKAEHKEKTLAAWSDYEDKNAVIGYTFNFMEGKNSSVNAEYNEQIEKLALGELQEKDANGDGVVSLAEYITFEINDSVMELTKEEIEETVKLATNGFMAIDFRFTDKPTKNGDGNLSLGDLKFFYTVLDAYQYNDDAYDCIFGDTIDGEIDIESADAYFSNFENHLNSILSKSEGN